MNLQSMKEPAFPEWFKNHPMVQTLIKEKTGAVLKRRQDALTEIEHLKKEMETSIGKAQPSIDKFNVEIKCLENQLAKLRTKHAEAVMALREMKYGIEYQIQTQEKILRSTYDSRIDEDIEFLRQKIDWLRLPNNTTTGQYLGEANAVNLKRGIRIVSNNSAVLGAIKYVQSAISEFEGMKLLPEYDANRAEELKQNIPSIKIYDEIKSYGHPLPGLERLMNAFPTPQTWGF